MRIPRLVWGMIVRGFGWTAPVGALLGALYSLVVIGAQLYATQKAPGPVQLPALVVMAIFLLVGGALVGGGIGLVFGPLGGFLCAMITRFLFHSSPDARYLRMVKMIGAVYGAAATVIGVLIVTGFNAPTPTSPTGNALVFYFLPALVGLGAGVYIAQQIAGWYREASQGAHADSKPTSAAA
ncbi:MAG: hypothetical protein WCF84_01235 [Anaerolineae bacterium]